VLRRFTAAGHGDVNASAVAVLTGGARGITACLAKALFEATGCRLVLMGRTSPDGAVAAFDLAAERQRARELLGAQASHEQIHAHVEERRRRAEVAETLRALRAAGAEVDYVCADATEPGALARVLTEVRSRFGRTDWVIHGAGIDHSHAVRSAPALSAPVLQTKLTALDSATLAVAPGAKWVALSSISAVYGNAGQLEYAAANEAMARVIRERGGLALDFGPWRDVGMAARLQGLLKGRGIDALDGAAAARSATALIAGDATGAWDATRAASPDALPMSCWTSQRPSSSPPCPWSMRRPHGCATTRGAARGCCPPWCHCPS
jgi:NAD(P)-dependent dehydrogenase (short-subunit alcohol dehydrogenase family)